MIRSADSYQISDLFDIVSKVKYTIPKYQREFVWRKEQIEDLLLDIMEDEGHFLGSIISINRGKDALGILPLEIVDGQQRLTTISLMYAAIYSILLKMELRSEEFITEKNNLKNRLIISDKTNITYPRIELSFTKQNQNDYTLILSESNLLSTPNMPDGIMFKRHLYKTYDYLKRKFKDQEFTELVRILTNINSARIVKIEVETYADAFTLFESLNNRGIPLSPIDIIKNKAFSEFEKRSQSIDDAFNRWQRLVNNLPDYRSQERFFRQFYNAFKYKENVKLENINKATMSNLIKIYERLIEKDVEFIFNELIDQSDVYGIFLDSNRNPNSSYNQDLVDLLHIGAAPAYTFLLYLFSKCSDKVEDEILLQKIIEFLVKYFVRRNLTDFPSTRDIDTVFISLIPYCEELGDAFSYKSLISYFKKNGLFSRLSVFEEKLSSDMYIENLDVTRFILYKIEETKQTKEIYKELWTRDNNGRYLWTIEHILPEGEKIPERWVKMIAEGNYQKAKDIQIEWVHKIGNLTLSAYNPNLSNFDFDTKRDRNIKDNSGKLKYIGYRNGLFLNEDLQSKRSWKAKDIKERSEKLKGEVLGLFTFELDN